MSYSEIAQLELMNALNSINSEAELNEFKDLVARYFAEKAQKAIDALWDEGVINEETIEQWGEEHMRTPYRYASFLIPTAFCSHCPLKALITKYGQIYWAVESVFV